MASVSHTNQPKPKENRVELSSRTPASRRARWCFWITLFLLYLAAVIPRLRAAGFDEPDRTYAGKVRLPKRTGKMMTGGLLGPPCLLPSIPSAGYIEVANPKWEPNRGNQYGRRPRGLPFCPDDIQRDDPCQPSSSLHFVSEIPLCPEESLHEITSSSPSALFRFTLSHYILGKSSQGV